MKYLLLLAVLALLWSLWKKRRDAPPRHDQPRPDPAPLNMQVCARCGVHFPENEGIRDGADFYCCEAHRQAARSAGR